MAIGGSLRKRETPKVLDRQPGLGKSTMPAQGIQPLISGLFKKNSGSGPSSLMGAGKCPLGV